MDSGTFRLGEWGYVEKRRPWEIKKDVIVRMIQT